jgi:dTDP-4-amino-4,6-dideoxygalactose transaminase
LLLQALQLPAGSEVAISALTIPDMVRIVRDRGLTPVPVDLHPATLAPEPASLERAITASTRLIVVAHLFGTRAPIEPVLEKARSCGALVVEDCAQAYAPGFTGHPEADVSCFSFGSIKRATALGGALLRVRYPALAELMRQIQAGYPLQSRLAYTRRLLKYAGLKALENRPAFAALVATCKLLGADCDRLLNQAVRGFAGGELFPRLRQQPCTPLLALLAHRLRRYTPARMAAQVECGETLVRLLRQRCPWVTVPGSAAPYRSHWVVPVLAENRQALIAALAAAGFDATRGSSMCVPDAPDGPYLPATATGQVFERLVYLPCYPAMSPAALVRMTAVLAAQQGNMECFGVLGASAGWDGKSPTLATDRH